MNKKISHIIILIAFVGFAGTSSALLDVNPIKTTDDIIQDAQAKNSFVASIISKLSKEAQDTYARLLQGHVSGLDTERQVVDRPLSSVSGAIVAGGLANPEQSIAVPELGSPGVCAFRYSGVDDSFAIQQELQNQGYTITKVDGKIGPETAAAVKAFQTDISAKKIDGIIGEETRAFLSAESLFCLGDTETSATDLVNYALEPSLFCTLGYSGVDDSFAIQQELQNQGYTITKVDGKIGPETAAAVKAFQTDISAKKIDGIIGAETQVELSRASRICPSINLSRVSVVSTGDTSSASTRDPDGGIVSNVVVVSEVAPSQGANTQSTTTENLEQEAVEIKEAFIVADSILADVRSTVAGIPDDTAVFTYKLIFNNEVPVYISSLASKTFDVTVLDAQGAIVDTSSATNSLVSNGKRIVRADDSVYYLISKGDIISLRTTLQPGAGTYVGELGRFSYSTQSAFDNQNPQVINYGFDAIDWTSDPVTLLN